LPTSTWVAIVKLVEIVPHKYGFAWRLTEPIAVRCDRKVIGRLSLWTPSRQDMEVLTEIIRANS
jgi:hypothetical protein